MVCFFKCSNYTPNRIGAPNRTFFFKNNLQSQTSELKDGTHGTGAGRTSGLHQQGWARWLTLMWCVCWVVDAEKWWPWLKINHWLLWIFDSFFKARGRRVFVFLGGKKLVPQRYDPSSFFLFDEDGPFKIQTDGTWRWLSYVFMSSADLRP